MPTGQQETCPPALRCRSNLSLRARSLMRITYLHRQLSLTPSTTSLQHIHSPPRLFVPQSRVRNSTQWPPSLAMITCHTPSLSQTFYISHNRTETHWSLLKRMPKYLNDEDLFAEGSPPSLPLFHRQKMRHGGGALRIGMNIPFVSEVGSDEISALSCSVLAICEPLYPRLN